MCFSSNLHNSTGAQMYVSLLVETFKTVNCYEQINKFLKGYMCQHLLIVLFHFTTDNEKRIKRRIKKRISRKQEIGNCIEIEKKNLQITLQFLKDCPGGATGVVPLTKGKEET